MLQYWWIGSASKKADDCPNEREFRESARYTSFAYDMPVVTDDDKRNVTEYLSLVS